MFFWKVLVKFRVSDKFRDINIRYSPKCGKFTHPENSQLVRFKLSSVPLHISIQ